jgi:alkanesulfonate monooxygenase
MPTNQQPRFGVWSLVCGTWASLHHPQEPFDASWERNKAQILEAEELGYDTTLLAQHTINPFGDGYDELEAWTAAAGLAALTKRIEIIAAIKPYLYHPVVLAKMALQIEAISGGRFGINLVNAWYKPELQKAGIGFAEHDERYAYGREWITIVRDLIAGERVNFHGRFFDVDGYELWPKDKHRGRPRIYIGGESDPARALAADAGDVWFINGQPPDNVRSLIADVAARPRLGRPIKFGLSAFVIARDTDAEAQDELAYAWTLAEKDKPVLSSLFGHADQKAVMFQTFAKMPHIGTNGGTAAGLVGSYETVAQRIREFHAIGIDTFMLQFQPFETEMRRFARHVLPRFRPARAVA